MGRALRDDDQITGFHLDLLVAKPDSPCPFEDVLDLVGVGMHVPRYVAVLHRDGRAVRAHEHLGTKAGGRGGAKRIAHQFGNVNDLRGDVFGRERWPQEMRDAAAGSERSSNR